MTLNDTVETPKHFRSTGKQLFRQLNTN